MRRAPVVNRPRNHLQVMLAAVGCAMALVACGSSGSQPSSSARSRSFVAFSVCMRAHGVPDFPDPNSRGEISLSDQPGSDLNPSSPALQAAERSCAGIAPNKFNPTPAERAQVTAKLLRFARCVRAHKVPNFPDPGSLGPGQGIGFLIDRNTLDRHSPALQAALRACESLIGGSAAFKSYG
jgi:hypothetical protein